MTVETPDICAALFFAVYKRQTFNGDVHFQRVHVVILYCYVLVRNSVVYPKYHDILDLVQNRISLKWRHLDKA